MKSKKAENAESWRINVDNDGFIGEYARFGLKMLRVAVNGKSAVRAVEKRKASQAVYNRIYYLRHKEKLREYHHKRYLKRKNREVTTEKGE